MTAYTGKASRSSALVAQVTLPDAPAVEWLLQQQCADGAFTAYRANTARRLHAPAEDENATALAIQAWWCSASRQRPRWRRSSTSSLPTAGSTTTPRSVLPASDANSTGLALSALAAAGIDPATVTSRR